MPVLSTPQRNQLEKTVADARRSAEKGARGALRQLTVDEKKAGSHLGEDDRTLRKRLRAHARQLGDGKSADDSHGIEHLVEECAYEHWHRMLFARFLAENQLLRNRDDVAVTLAECGELAEHEKLADGWAVAAHYAQRMLPQIFRPDEPVLQVRLPPEAQRALEKLLGEVSPEVFLASDALGWVYQFWQAQKKDEINASEVKIGADQIAAVTQLFTEPYMVDFLLQNTLGAWWVGRHQEEGLPVEMPYLRRLEDGTPAAGTFDGWPKTAAKLKVLDPCCGSGHFLVAALPILARFRMVEEELSAAAACDAVLRDNLHGLEIDARCTQIAAFALALASWTFPNAGGYRELPEMHIACSGQGVRAKKEEWLALAGSDAGLQAGMERLYGLFQDAPTLGSLVDPTTVSLSGQQHELGVARFEELWPLLETQLATESVSDAQRQELSVTAKGIAEAARILSGGYSLIATNVPYLGRAQMSSTLSSYCDSVLPAGASNLATAFIERFLLGSSTKSHGVVALVAPQNWLVQDSYSELRKLISVKAALDLVAPLGVNAFSTITGHVVNVLLLVAQHVVPRADSTIAIVDAEDAITPDLKSQLLVSHPIRQVLQTSQAVGTRQRFSLLNTTGKARLGEFIFSTEGMSTGDADRFQRCYWELGKFENRWAPIQDAPTAGNGNEGTSSVVLWENGQSVLASFEGARIRGHSAWRKPGVLVARIGTLRSAQYRGGLFSKSCVVLTPRLLSLLSAIQCYAASSSFSSAVADLNKKVSVPTKVFEDIPFDLTHWQKVAEEKYPNGLPEPYSEDPTQWTFKGTVIPSTEPLQVAVARLLGYRWPDQQTDSLDEHCDDDGIVCIPPVRGEEPAAARLQALLIAAYGSGWSPHKLQEILQAVGCAGKTLEHWLREKFFAQHCALFQQRPFVWHIWDGLRKDGFAALVNYHQLDRKLLETLTYNYLGDWLKRQEDGITHHVEGATERRDAALLLQKKLQLVLDGEAPHDLFVRWKPLAQQPIGWQPDINDGVRLNLRPFVTAKVLRKDPKVDWGKDRGKDPAGSPWGPERLNDRHFTLEEKRAARG